MTTSLILIYLIYIYIYIYTYVCIYVYRQILMHSHWYLLLSLLHIKINFTLVFTSLIRVYKAVNQVFNIILTLETWILVVISFSIVLVIIELTNLMKCFALLLINLKLERFLVIFILNWNIFSTHCSYEIAHTNHPSQNEFQSGFYIKDELEYKICKDLTSKHESLEVLLIEIHGRNKNSPTLICVAYQPSSMEVEKLGWLEKVLMTDIYISWNGTLILTGDFNMWFWLI